MSREPLQIRPHFKEDDFDASDAWVYAFNLLIPNEVGKYLSGQVEKENTPFRSKGALLSDASAVVSPSARVGHGGC